MYLCAFLRPGLSLPDAQRSPRGPLSRVRVDPSETQPCVRCAQLSHPDGQAAFISRQRRAHSIRGLFPSSVVKQWPTLNTSLRSSENPFPTHHRLRRLGSDPRRVETTGAVHAPTRGPESCGLPEPYRPLLENGSKQCKTVSRVSVQNHRGRGSKQGQHQGSEFADSIRYVVSVSWTWQDLWSSLRLRGPAAESGSF